MNYFLEVFGGIPLSTVIIFIAAMVFIVGVGVKVYRVMVKYHDDLQDKENTLTTLQSDVKNIKEKQDSFSTKTEIHRIEAKQTHLEEMVTQILEKQEELIQRQDEIEQENKEQSLNKLRDRLLQSYRYYTSTEKNPLGAWSEMEHEAFYKLFKDYERLGGNGFMHSTVEPSMAALNVIRIDDEKKMNELMKSRKG